MNSVILQFHHSAWVISCTRRAKTLTWPRLYEVQYVKALALTGHGGEPSRLSRLSDHPGGRFHSSTQRRCGGAKQEPRRG